MGRWECVFSRLQQHFGVTRPIGAFAENTVNAVDLPLEGDPTAVGRPHRIGVVGLAKGDAGGDVALEVVHPDIPVLAALDRDREPVAIG